MTGLNGDRGGWQNKEFKYIFDAQKENMWEYVIF